MTYQPGYAPLAANSPGGYIPGIANIKNFQVNWNQWETIRNSLYDSAVYAAAGQAQLTFFALPQGQGTGLGGGAKTATDTNMQLAGQIPANQMFLIQQVEVAFEPTTPTVAAGMPAVFGAQLVATIVNDAYIFYRAGNLNLQIGSKSYLQEAPLMKFPAYAAFDLSAAVADGGQSSASGAQQSRIAFGTSRGTPYVLTPNNLLLVQNQNFSVTLNWPEGVQAIVNPARVIISLNGFLYRKAQ